MGRMHHPFADYLFLDDVVSHTCHNLNLLQVKGRSDLFFRLEIIKKAIGIGIMCITISHGIIWMVSGGIASSMISLIINTYYTGKLIHVGYLRQMGDLLPIFSVSVAMWFLVHGSLLATSNIYAQLVIGIIVGLASYLLGARFLLKNEWDEALSMIPNRFKPKRNI